MTDTMASPPPNNAQDQTPTTFAASAVATQFVPVQPPNEWLARVFLGAEVLNATGARVGDVTDLVFDHSGRITAVVLSVGGILGIGAKSVAVPFDSLVFTSDSDGERVITLPLDEEALRQAPPFSAIEKTTMDLVADRAADLGHKAGIRATELAGKAAKKIGELTKGTPPRS